MRFALVLLLFISAAILRQFYGGSEFRALSQHLRILTGLTQSFQIVDQGKIDAPHDSASMIGPHLLMIKPDNAVILERGVQRTRVSGPAMLTIRLFEMDSIGNRVVFMSLNDSEE